MIVGRDSVAAILDGRLDVVRFPVDPAEPYYRQRRLRVGDTRQSRQLVTPFAPRAGDRMPVRSHARARPACWVIVASAEVGPHEIPPMHHIKAMGYRSATEYRAGWVRRHDGAWVEREEELVDGVPACRWPRRPLAEVELSARFVEHWLGALVWITTIAVDRVAPSRLLERRAGLGEDGYVTSPAQALAGDLDPGEAVDQGAQAKITERARLDDRQFAVLDEARRHRLAVADLAREVEAEAEAAGVDISTQLAGARKRLESARAKIRRTRRAA